MRYFMRVLLEGLQFYISPQEFQAELYLPAHSLRTGELAEGCVADGEADTACIRQLERRSIGQIERFSPEFETRFLGGPDVLEDGQVKVLLARAAENRASGVSQGLDRSTSEIGNGRGHLERAGVEVLIEARVLNQH